MQSIFPIIGKIFSSPYDWGGNKLIPQTLGFTPEPGIPYAEYWLGVHKKGPTEVDLIDGTTDILENLIAKNPEEFLGHTVSERFGTLPFLFKLLDAGEMLSIQVHPNKKQAEEGFEDEEKEKIPMDDPKRTYKDDNQKSEYAVVLGDFWLLHGFRNKENLEKLFNEVTELSPLVPYFKDGDYHTLYKYIMIDMNDEEANNILNKIAQRVMPLFEENKLEKTNPDYWTAKAIKYMHMKENNYDRGLFSIYLLNLINLKPGQSIFQDTGVLHAYLEGAVIEVMTNSDNVARGGITSKYVDRDALMKLVLFEGINPVIIEGNQERTEEFFKAPIADFLVSKIIPTLDEPYDNKTISAEMLIGMQGDARIIGDEESFSIGQGKSFIVKAGTHYEISGNDTDVVYRISIPLE